MLHYLTPKEPFAYKGETPEPLCCQGTQILLDIVNV